MSDFGHAVSVILYHEGGFTNNQNDSGNWTGGKKHKGELRGTKYGISAAAYPHLDIESLTKDDAKEIYKKDYWNKVRGDKLPFPVALYLFDMAVNMGVKRSVKMLQGIVGVKRDGIIGPKTIGKIACFSSIYLTEQLAYERIMYYTRLKDFEHFGKGWVRRSVETLTTAIQGRNNG